MQTFKIKKKDTSPALSATLQFSNGSIIDLTNGSVFFQMGNLNDFTPYFSGACAITNAVSGICEYRWTGSVDTGSTGNYWGAFKIVWPGSIMTLPNDNSLQIQVFEDYQ